MYDKLTYRWTTCTHVMESIKCPECVKERLLSLLGTERDAWGKRETEILAERDRWKGMAAKLLGRMKIINGRQGDCNIADCENHRVIHEVESALKEGL